MSIKSVTTDVSATAAYPGTPQITFNFKPKTITAVLENASNDAFISFDGVTDHAHLVPGFPSAGLVFHQRVTKVWLRRGAAGAGPTNVQVIGEQF